MPINQPESFHSDSENLPEQQKGFFSKMRKRIAELRPKRDEIDDVDRLINKAIELFRFDLDTVCEKFTGVDRIREVNMLFGLELNDRARKQELFDSGSDYLFHRYLPEWKDLDLDTQYRKNSDVKERFIQLAYKEYVRILPELNTVK